MRMVVSAAVIALVASAGPDSAAEPLAPPRAWLASAIMAAIFSCALAARGSRVPVSGWGF